MWKPLPVLLQAFAEMADSKGAAKIYEDWARRCEEEKEKKEKEKEKEKDLVAEEDALARSRMNEI